MRTLDPIFQAAMDSGHFTPIVRAAILDPDDHSVIQYLDLKYFKINGLDLDVEFYDPSGSFTDKISLERGVKVGDTEYTLFSGEYFLTSSYKVTGGKYGLYKCSGSLIEPVGVNLAGDDTYHDVIGSVLSLGDCTAAFKHPAASWLSYQFLADGSFFHTSNIYTFFTLLKQKYLIHATENGLGSILFFDVASVLAGAPSYTVTLNDRDIWSSFANYRQFVWRDEADTVHTDGPAGYPNHNLGYLESTASPPVIPDYKMPIGETLLTIIPNLKYQTGDLVTFDANIDGVGDVNTVIDVTEIYDARDRRGDLYGRPSWRMELRPLQFFANTEGGHIETSSQYTTPYVPLATSGFHGLLDDNVNNLQALADAVDSLAMGGSGTAGRIAQFDSAHKLEASNLIGPAVNVLTLESTGEYTLTIPAAGIAAIITVDTRANILASTPTSGKLAYANDIERFYVADGTSWFQIVPNGAVADSAVPDMGAEADSARTGYGDTYLVNKAINYCTIGANGAASNGGIKVTTAGDFYFYSSATSTWQRITANFVFRENSAFGYTLEHMPVGLTWYYEIMTGQSLNNLGMNGLPLVNGYKSSMGVYPLPTVVGGRIIA